MGTRRAVAVVTGVASAGKRTWRVGAGRVCVAIISPSAAFVGVHTPRLGTQLNIGET